MVWTLSNKFLGFLFFDAMAHFGSFSTFSKFINLYLSYEGHIQKVRLGETRVGVGFKGAERARIG